MWCDNCLLLLPLRAGAIAWGSVIVLYSVIGAILLFLYGEYFFFVFPEWQIYGGISLFIAFLALINIIALSNRSYIWTRVAKSLWPFAIIISAVRCIAMIVELTRGHSKIDWECDNGGTIWWTNESYATHDLPSSFCTVGYSSIFWGFVFSLLIDLAFQMYMFFLSWRYEKRLEHYRGLQGPFAGGYYKA